MGLNKNFTNTTLDDEAGTAITSGSAPFSGTYRPEGLLSKFDGQNANGQWRLQISDDQSGTTGTLNSWSLIISYAEPSTVTGSEGTYAFSGLPAGNYVVRQVPQSGWLSSSPSAGYHATTLAAGQTQANLDFGNRTPDPEVSASVSPVQVGEDGTASLVYTFTRQGDTSGELTVNFSVAGTGVFDNDYAASGAATFSATSGSVTFAAGSGTAAIIVDPTADMVVEDNETVVLTLLAGTGYSIASPDTATGTIIDDDTALAIVAADAVKAEGNEGFTQFTFTVTRPGLASGATTVDYAVTGSGGAPADEADFGGVFPSGQVVFADLETARTITILVAGDLLVEADEEFTVTLSNASGGAQILTASAMGTIVNDDAAARLSALSAQPALLSDGTLGPAVFAVTVEFDRPMNAAVAPLVTFAPDLSDTLTLNASLSEWTSDTVYVARYDVADSDLDLASVDIEVSATFDAGGNPVAGLVAADQFSVDMLNPAVTNVVARVEGPRGDNFDFESGLPAPWIAFSAGAEPVPHEIVEFDVDGDGQTSLALRLAPGTEGGDGVARRLHLQQGVLYTIELEIAEANESLTAAPGIAAATLLIDGAVIDSFSFLDTYGSIPGEATFRASLHGAFTPQRSGEHTLAIAFQRAAGEESGVWAYADNVLISQSSDRQIDEADADGKLVVTVSYSEPMDTAVAPTLTFAPEVAGTLAWSEALSHWADNTTYVAIYEVADADASAAAVDIEVAGARDAAGSPQAPFLALDRFSIDTRGPAATIASVSPDPRHAELDSMTIVFDEPVLGFDLVDLTLARDGGENLLTDAHTLGTEDGGLTWTLGNLADPTRIPGSYSLRLAAAGSGIVDLAGNLLAADAETQWLLDNRAPVAAAGGAYRIGLGMDLTLDAGASYDPDAETGDFIATYEWDIDGDGFYEKTAATSQLVVPHAELAGLDPGVHTMGLRVIDSRGLAGADTAFLEIRGGQIAGTPGDDRIRIVLAAAEPARADVFINTESPKPTYSVLLAHVARWEIAGGEGDDELTVDFSNGSPLPAGGLFWDGQEQATDDLLVLRGTAGSDDVIVTAGQVVVAGAPVITYADNECFAFELGEGEDSLTVNGAAVRLNREQALSAGAAVTLSNGGVLDLGGRLQSIDVLTVRSGSVTHGTLAANAFNVQQGTIDAELTGPGGLLKSTAGVLVLGGNNTYTGGTLISGGVLQTPEGSAHTLPESGELKLSGGTLDLSGQVLIVGPATVASGSLLHGTLISNSYLVQSGAIGATLAGPAELVKTSGGTAILLAANEYSGGTRVEEGILEVADANALPPGGSLMIGSGGTVVLGAGLAMDSGSLSTPTVPAASTAVAAAEATEDPRSALPGASLHEVADAAPAADLSGRAAREAAISRNITPRDAHWRAMAARQAKAHDAVLGTAAPRSRQDIAWPAVDWQWVNFVSGRGGGRSWRAS